MSAADPPLSYIARAWHDAWRAVRHPRRAAGNAGGDTPGDRVTFRDLSRGFTLIEVMVALAVFSLAALALIRLEGQTIRSTGVVRATLLAQMVARNVAIDAVTSADLPPRGTTQGVEQNGGMAWRWTRNVQPVGDGDVQRIDVTVADAGGASLGRITMVRPPPPPIAVVGQ